MLLGGGGGGERERSIDDLACQQSKGNECNFNSRYYTITYEICE